MVKMMKNNDGGALIITLMILVVVSILGMALLNIGVAESKFATYQEKKAQAYYLAHSGADSLASYIVKNPDNLPTNELETKISSIIDLPSAENDSLSSHRFANETFNVSLSKILGTNNLFIESQGKVDNVSQKVSVNIIKRGLFENAIYAHKSLTLWSGAKVYGGDVQYGESYYAGNNAEIIDGEAYVGELEFDANDFPSLGLNTPDNLVISNGEVISVTMDPPSGIDYVNENIYYSSIEVNPKGKFVIDLNNNDVKIVVDTLNIEGTLEIIGSGKLLLYVREEAYFRGIINSNANNLFLYIGDYNPVSNSSGSYGYIELKTGNSVFNGYIIGINATVDITANLVYTGAIIAETVMVASNSEVHYDIEIFPEDLSFPSLGYKTGLWKE